MHLKLRMEKKYCAKSRGISENILSYKDYKKLFKGEMLKLEIKKIFKRVDTLSIHKTTFTYNLHLNKDINKRENIYDKGK